MPEDRASRLWLAGSLSVALHGSLTVLLIFAPLHRDAEDCGPIALGAITLESPDEPPEIIPATLRPLEPSFEPETVIPAVERRVQPSSSIQAATQIVNTVGTDQGSPGASKTQPRPPVSPRVMPAFFEIPVRGRSVVYVLDRSGSMGQHGRLAAVKRELLASLSGMPSDTRFQVIFYNKQPQLLRLDAGSRLALASSENKERAEQQIQALAAEGATEHLEALRLALALEPDEIFFLTDAADLTNAQVEAITQGNRGRTAIHTLELVSHRENDLPLKVLARRNRGVYRAVGER